MQRILFTMIILLLAASITSVGAMAQQTQSLTSSCDDNPIVIKNQIDIRDGDRVPMTYETGDLVLISRDEEVTMLTGSVSITSSTSGKHWEYGSPDSDVLTMDVTHLLTEGDNDLTVTTDPDARYWLTTFTTCHDEADQTLILPQPQRPAPQSALILDIGHTDKEIMTQSLTPFMIVLLTIITLTKMMQYAWIMGLSILATAGVAFILIRYRQRIAHAADRLIKARREAYR